MELHATELTLGLNIVTMVKKILRTTAKVMHELFRTIKERIYKSACWHLSTQAGVGLYPLTGMVLIYHWNNSACFTPDKCMLTQFYTILSTTIPLGLAL